MPQVHPLVLQLRFTRSEFIRALRGVSEADARKRLEPMNCIAWNVGHLAWQEQEYFVTKGQGSTPRPDIRDRFYSGGPPSTPQLSEVLAAWREITAAADPWLDTLTPEFLAERVTEADGKATKSRFERLLGAKEHEMHHRAQLMLIERQLGIVPHLTRQFNERVAQMRAARA